MKEICIYIFLLETYLKILIIYQFRPKIIFFSYTSLNDWDKVSENFENLVDIKGKLLTLYIFFVGQNVTQFNFMHAQKLAIFGSWEAVYARYHLVLCKKAYCTQLFTNTCFSWPYKLYIYFFDYS